MEQAGVHLDVTNQRRAQSSGPAFPHWLTVRGGLGREGGRKSTNYLTFIICHIYWVEAATVFDFIKLYTLLICTVSLLPIETYCKYPLWHAKVVINQILCLVCIVRYYWLIASGCFCTSLLLRDQLTESGQSLAVKITAHANYSLLILVIPNKKRKNSTTSWLRTGVLLLKDYNYCVTTICATELWKLFYCNGRKHKCGNSKGLQSAV